MKLVDPKYGTANLPDGGSVFVTYRVVDPFTQKYVGIVKTEEVGVEAIRQEVGRSPVAVVITAWSKQAIADEANQSTTEKGAQL